MQSAIRSAVAAVASVVVVVAQIFACRRALHEYARRVGVEEDDADEIESEDEKHELIHVEECHEPGQIELELNVLGLKERFAADLMKLVL